MNQSISLNCLTRAARIRKNCEGGERLRNDYRRLCLIALCGSLLASCFSFGGASGLTLRGRVRESRGERRPIAGATVTLRGSGGIEARTESRADGSYEITTNQPVSFPLTLIVSKFGYEPPHSRQITSAPAGDLDVTLEGPVTYTPARPVTP